MNKNLKKIITIDGPAGAGKSTLAKELARRLTWVYLDTGAIYRAVAVTALARGTNPSEQAAAESLAQSLSIEIAPGGAGIRVDGEDVTARLRSPEVSLAASQISAYPLVRQALFSLQRAMGDRGEVVAEGRDMGTVVFPDAGLKFFLMASPEARAKRRFEELRAKNPQIELASVLADQIKRDEADQNRAIAPLKAAADAMNIDSTNISVNEVLEVMVRSFRNRFLSD